MTPASRERLQVWKPLLALSAIAWILLAVEGSGMGMPTHCSAPMLAVLPAPLDSLLAPNPARSFAAGWGLMLAAMMVPLLASPVRHVRDRSFTHRRVRAITLFVAGYGAIWMVAGVLLLALTLAIRVFVSSLWVPLPLVALITIVWQCSPIKQRCLNRNHVHRELAAFGLEADLDALRFGCGHGVWCFGSCWTLMLLCFVIAHGHLTAMAAVTLWLFAERLERPVPPGWRWRGPSKLARIVVAQARMRLPGK